MSSLLRPQHVRQMIAQQAARLMAEEGAQDYAYAKRKAARQMGALDDRSLPTNAEIERELKLYHDIFRSAEQPQHLHALRSEALDIMRLLAHFNPLLAGAVLDGTAGRYADTDIHLFADSLKDVEIYLLNQSIPYQMEERSVRIGQDKRRVPVFVLPGVYGTIRLSVFDTEDMRLLPRTTGLDGSPTRATVEALSQLLETGAPT